MVGWAVGIVVGGAALGLILIALVSWLLGRDPGDDDLG